MNDIENYGKLFSMSYDLRDYIKVYNVFEKQLCEKVIESLNHDNWNVHSFYNYKDNVYTSYDYDFNITYEADPQLVQVMMDQLWHQIKRYIDELKMPFFEGWNGYTQIGFNKYDVGKAMKLHHDGIKSIFDGERKGDPTITIVGVLNDDYEGGQFVVCDKVEVPLKQGDIIMFPSTFLYPHKVLPVTRGSRYSFVSWVW